MSIKLLVLGGGILGFFLGGGGKCRFYFICAGIFLTVFSRVFCPEDGFSEMAGCAEGDFLLEGQGFLMLFLWARGFF